MSLLSSSISSITVFFDPSLLIYLDTHSYNDNLFLSYIYYFSSIPTLINIYPHLSHYLTHQLHIYYLLNLYYSHYYIYLLFYNFLKYLNMKAHQ